MAQQSHIDRLKQEITYRVKDDMDNRERYSNILHLLIMEGLFKVAKYIHFSFEQC